MQLENAAYRVIHKRKNITVFFAEHPEFLKINDFYTHTHTHTLWVNSGKST